MEILSRDALQGSLFAFSVGKLLNGTEDGCLETLKNFANRKKKMLNISQSEMSLNG